jgi:chromosome segregation ATPase
MTTTEADAAALRLIFSAAAESFPGSVTAFLNRQPTENRTSPGEREADKLMGWWTALYSAIRDSAAGLKILGELQLAKDRIAELHLRLAAANDRDAFRVNELSDADQQIEVLSRRLEEAKAEIASLTQNLQGTISGFRSHLADLASRIGPGRLPEDIKARLWEMHTSYNSWTDKSAEVERDKLLAEITEKDKLLAALTERCKWHAEALAALAEKEPA